MLLFFLFPETRRMYPDGEQPIVATSSQHSRREAIEEDKGREEARVENLAALPTNIPAREDHRGAGKPSLAQFSLSQPINRKALRYVVRHCVTPVQLFFFPIIFWASMSMGAAANALLAVNLLQSQALAAPPYNFDSAQVGNANFALVVGGIVGLSLAGPWSDWVSARATRRNNGIREPEMRLIALIPFIAAALVGLTVSFFCPNIGKGGADTLKAFGVGIQNQWPWPAVVVVGFGLVGLQVVAIPTITITYAIDCYKPVTGEIMVIATVCKNTFGVSQPLNFCDRQMFD